jgi:hypothetical protein
MTWQPFETAPKDGTEFIVFGLMRGDWGYTEDQLTWTGCRYENGEFRKTKPTSQYDCGWKFTHWLPLPPPPTK